MANIRQKSIQELESWNLKELRKLRISVKNRIQSLEFSKKPKELPSSHPLSQMGVEECKNLLQKVQKAERDLVK
ncbi:MAG: hypothetical protein CME64_06495 [Halobacteriovoraceae bacterium]|nr:hypothetical protein [Halobacteriovoraceae bacterium]|tara:strand:- start:52033 stop:52254 length:222 start_codon:yes stop_codon:yes gene_type:complete